MRRGPSRTLDRCREKKLPSLCPHTAVEGGESGRYRAFPLGKSEWLLHSAVLPQPVALS